LLNNDASDTANSGRIFFEGTSTSAIFQSGGALSFRTGATTGSSSGTQKFYIDTSGATVVGNLTVSGNSFMNYGLVVNEGGNNADFRVESVNNPNMLKVDASADAVLTEKLIDSATHIGTVGSHSLDGGTLSTTDWANFPVGYRAMIRSSNGTTYGSPVNNYGYFLKVANRDTSGGWGGIWVGYAAGENYLGRTSTSGSYASWEKIWTSGNDGSGSTLDADLLDGLEGSSYWTKGGSWVGDLGSNGYTRVQGVANGGGEFVLALKNSQLNTLIDGSYFAYEASSAAGGGFWSSYNSSYANATGFKATGTSTIAVTQQDGGSANLEVTGNVRTADGTAASPAFSFTSDTDTGMYRLGDDDLGFTAGGSLKYGILNGLNRFYSNVVVGPNNNNSKPYIQYKDGYDTASTPSYSWYYDNGCGMGHPAGSTIAFSTGSNERLRINNSGLSVTGDMTINGHITMQSGHHITAHNESSYAKYRMYGGSSAYAIGMYSGNAFGGLNDWAMTFTFNDEADRGFLWRDTAHSQGQGAMSLTTNGKLAVAHSVRLGYGESDTTTPGGVAGLDVNSNIYINNTGTAPFALGEKANTLRIKGNGTGAFNFLNSGNGWANLYFNRAFAQDYFQADNNGTLLRLYKSSWTNATTHDIILNAYQTTLGDYTYLKSAGNSTGTHGIIVASDNYIFMGRDDLTTGGLDNSATAPITDCNFRLDASGNGLFDGDVVAYSTTIASDARLKENVKDLNYGLKDVLDIRPVSFDWIDKRDGQHDIGVIAQEIEKIIPEVVVEVDTLNSEDTHKTVDYAKLTSVLIKAVQEQQQQINELKEKLNG
jgi:hypothetical protein